MALFGNVFNKADAATALEQAAVVVRQKVLDKAIERSSAAFGATTPVVTEAFNNRPVLNTRAYAATSDSPATAISTKTPGLDLSWFEAGLDKSSYLVLHRHVDDYKLVYTVSVPLLDHTGTQLLTVEVGQSACVVVHGLKNLRHVNHDSSLCLWFPDDGPGRRWTHEKGLVSLLDLVTLHLYKEARFKETGVWLGEEVHDA